MASMRIRFAVVMSLLVGLPAVVGTFNCTGTNIATEVNNVGSTCLKTIDGINWSPAGIEDPYLIRALGSDNYNYLCSGGLLPYYTFITNGSVPIKVYNDGTQDYFVSGPFTASCTTQLTILTYSGTDSWPASYVLSLPDLYTFMGECEITQLIYSDNVTVEVTGWSCDSGYASDILRTVSTLNIVGRFISDSGIMGTNRGIVPTEESTAYVSLVCGGEPCYYEYENIEAIVYNGDQTVTCVYNASCVSEAMQKVLIKVTNLNAEIATLNDIIINNNSTSANQSQVVITAAENLMNVMVDDASAMGITGVPDTLGIYAAGDRLSWITSTYNLFKNQKLSNITSQGLYDFMQGKWDSLFQNISQLAAGSSNHSNALSDLQYAVNSLNATINNGTSNDVISGKLDNLNLSITSVNVSSVVTGISSNLTVSSTKILNATSDILIRLNKLNSTNTGSGGNSDLGPLVEGVNMALGILNNVDQTLTNQSEKVDGVIQTVGSIDSRSSDFNSSLSKIDSVSSDIKSNNKLIWIYNVVLVGVCGLSLIISVFVCLKMESIRPTRFGNKWASAGDHDL